jgi:hypothetical protein
MCMPSTALSTVVKTTNVAKFVAFRDIFMSPVNSVVKFLPVQIHLPAQLVLAEQLYGVAYVKAKHFLLNKVRYVQDARMQKRRDRCAVQMRPFLSALSTIRHRMSLRLDNLERHDFCLEHILFRFISLGVSIPLDLHAACVDVRCCICRCS